MTHYEQRLHVRAPQAVGDRVRLTVDPNWTTEGTLIGYVREYGLLWAQLEYEDEPDFVFHVNVREIVRAERLWPQLEDA